MRLFSLAITAALLTASPTLAHDHGAGHAPAQKAQHTDHKKGQKCECCKKHAHKGMKKGEMCKKCAKHAHKNPAIAAYEASNERMHQDMDIVYTGDADTDFARGMVPHHQAALDMAKVLFKHGQSPEIRTLARRIVFMQQQEIAQMNSWLASKGYKTPLYSAETVAAMPHVRELKAAGHRMHNAMNIDYSGNADVDFVRGMIPHHQAAIDMAVSYQKHGRNAWLHKLARGIIQGQKQEIRIMQDWLEEHTQPARAAH